ncbi:hypothetical protein ADICYQ_5456 [Cyclobacterium qasimii M12-11B]|uniref:Uncharacterized protein n=1 Tax=Cyclobacterium qasimii M12-11B TaxID=641524 RepID=S7V5T0_9BACT|nr:hypothetical protein ADICYQ_5456 [Cyclobacterium qasimii M12-11B]
MKIKYYPNYKLFSKKSQPQQTKKTSPQRDNPSVMKSF